MPQKACEGGFCHVIIFLKCPKIEDFSFRWIFCFKIDHVLFFWNTPLFWARIFWNTPFFLSDSKTLVYLWTSRVEMDYFLSWEWTKWTAIQKNTSILSEQPFWLKGWTATNFWGERPVQKWLVLKCVFNVFQVGTPLKMLFYLRIHLRSSF